MEFVSSFLQYVCWILTLDRAINKRYIWAGRTCINKRKQSRGLSDDEGVMKWYMLMPMSVGAVGHVEAVYVYASLQSLRSHAGAASHKTSGCTSLAVKQKKC